MVTTEEDLKAAIAAEFDTDEKDEAKLFEDATKDIYGITPDYTQEDGEFFTGRVVWRVAYGVLEWRAPSDAAWMNAEETKRELAKYLEGESE